MKNTQKLHQIAPKVYNMQFFSIQSGKFYTGQNIFTEAPPVVPVTNMRYDVSHILQVNVFAILSDTDADGEA